MNFAQTIRIEIVAGFLDAGEMSILFLLEDYLYIDDRSTCAILRGDQEREAAATILGKA